jgi:hypothetical protein
MDIAAIKKPDLSYRYEFSLHELDQAMACNEAHGFCVIQDVLPDYLVASLREAVVEAADPEGKLVPGQSYTHGAFVETGPKAWQLLDYEPFMHIQKTLIGTDELTVHRSACIIRKQGSQPVVWHTDWRGFAETPPVDSGGVLNRGDWPSGKWFYITGSRPIHGGLCVIEDSHVDGWQGPEGFKLTQDRTSFYPEGEEEHRYAGFDIPGLVPFFTNPGDMIVFAHRTYHGAFSNLLEEDRLSCAIGFRRRDHKIETPWELPESAKAFMTALPDHLKHYTEGYTGIVPGWRA